MKVILSALFLVLTTLSCVNDAKLDFKDYQPNLVVNSLLVPDSVLTVNISVSLPADKNEAFMPVNDASVEIFDGKITRKLMRTGNGIYTALVKPLPGIEYGLTVTAKNGEVLSALTRIPSQPTVSITSMVEDNMVKVTIKDQPGEENFYWVGQRGYSYSSEKSFYDGYVYSNFLLFDDFNRTRGIDRFGRNCYSYHFYARLTDFSFNGREVTFTLPHLWMPPEEANPMNYANYLFIINADRYLDQYMKAAIVQYELGVVGDMPVFHTPINMFSNISNGKGIFGSYTFSQFDITKP